MDVGAVERLLTSLAFEGLGGLEFRVPAEVSRWVFAATRFQHTESLLRRLRPTRTTGFRSTGLMKEGPETLFLFVFGELCLLSFCFGLICYNFAFICFILALFVVK